MARRGTNMQDDSSGAAQKGTRAQVAYSETHRNPLSVMASFSALYSVAWLMQTMPGLQMVSRTVQLSAGGMTALALFSVASLRAGHNHGLQAASVPMPPEDEHLRLVQALAVVAGQSQATAGLVGLGDKQILFSPSGTAFVMYALRGRTLVVLFDPVGPEAEWPALLTALSHMARSRRLRLAFYQVSPRFLPFAVDAGFRLYKLGDQALVNLESFDLKGGDWVKLRRSINRAERDGLQFEWLEQAEIPPLLDALEAVSNAWLATHKAGEKGFSLGTFDRNYLLQHPLAVIKCEGRIVAFANVLTTDLREEAFIDLMRHLPGIHRGMMDLLFVKIMQHLKAAGFKRLNLGMAPLSGLSPRAVAPLWHHLGRLVYEHGEKLYNFKGVRAFKEKFDPDWQPRYLALSDNRSLLIAALDIALLIGGGIKGVLRR